MGLAGLLARAMGPDAVFGVDPVASRRVLAEKLGAVDVVEVSIDCSGSAAGRATALSETRRWGRAALVGEGARLEIDASPTLIHPQITLHGSWVTRIGRMAELVERLVRWDLHPERTVTDRFGLTEASDAYATADAGVRGKVALVMA